MNKIRWLINDESESSIHKTKKDAIKEYNRLWNMNYKHRNTMEILRHNQTTDEYSSLKINICMNCGVIKERRILKDSLGDYIVCDCNSSCDVN